MYVPTFEILGIIKVALKRRIISRKSWKFDYEHLKLNEHSIPPRYNIRTYSDNKFQLHLLKFNNVLLV